MLLAAAASGRADATATEVVQEPLDTVTIIGHRDDAADVAGSAHVVDKEELLEFRQADIMRVLRTVPGVYVQEEEGFGLRPNIGIRGSGLDRSSRIALLEDGVLIAPAPYAAPSAYYFPTQRRMDALEILKGPAAIAVGPRTTGGALNMISTPIPADFAASIDVRAGENQTFDTVARLGDRASRFGWLVETVQSQSDGFKHIDGPVGGNTGFDLEDYVLKLQLDSEPASAVYQSLRLKAVYTEQHSDETYLGLADEDFGEDPYRRYAASAGDMFDSEHSQYQLTYVVDPDKNWRVEITAYRNDFERNWYKLQSVNGVGISAVLDDPAAYAAELGFLKGDTSPADAISKRANKRSYYSEGLQAKAGWKLSLAGTDLDLTAGLRLHDDEEDRFQHEDAYRMEDGILVLISPGTEGSQSNRVAAASATAYFLSAAIQTGNWTLTPGMRHERIDLRRLDFSTSDPSRSSGPTRVRENSVSVTIPGLGALYRVSDSLRLLAGIHKGFNPPAPGSTASEESSLNLEAGIRYDRDALGLEAIAFVNDYDNLVGTVTNSTGGGGDIGDQFDGGRVTVSGLEMSGGYRWRLGQTVVPLSVRYTWTNEAEFQNGFESDFDPWGDVVAGDELPYIPEHQLHANVGLVQAKWRVSLGANYVGRIRTVAGQGPVGANESIGSRVVWDAVATWQLAPQFATYLKIDNLFDETYAAARRPAGLRPGLPRTAYLGFTYQL